MPDYPETVLAEDWALCDALRDEQAQLMADIAGLEADRTNTSTAALIALAMKMARLQFVLRELRRIGA